MAREYGKDYFGFKDVEAAYERLSKYLMATPLAESFYLGGALESEYGRESSSGRKILGLEGSRYFFKLESMQRAKSFKIRGALNKMLTLSESERLRGVATISSGNHGSSVAYAAKLLGIENAKIIVPKTTPKSKVDKIRYFGGDALLMGQNYDEAHALGMAYIEENGLSYIDAYYDDPLIYGGQGTVAIEILKQDPEIDTIVVPIGGGGLSTGVAVAAKHIKPEIRIIGVQTEACPAMIASYRDGKCYEEYPITGDTVCDSLVGGVGALSYSMLKDYADDFIEVSESSIRRALRFMALDEKYIIEGGSATTVAAVMDFPERIGGKNIALVISGGNIDGSVLKSVLG